MLKKINFNFWFLLPLALLPVLTMGTISGAIFLIVIFGIVFFYTLKRNKEDFSKDKRWFFITTMFYFWSIIAIIYSENILLGFKKLQSSLSLVLIPAIILIALPKIPKKVFNTINFIFVLASIILACYIQYYLISKDVYNNLGEVTFWNLPIREQLEKNPFKELHPTYIGIWFMYSFLFLLDYIVNNLRKLNKTAFFIFIATNLLLLITTVILSARIVFIAFVFALIIYLLFKIKSKQYKVLAIFIIFSSVVISTFTIPFLKSRLIDEIKETKFQPPIGLKHNSTNIRIGIYQCSLEVVRENWLIGVGLANVQNKLNNCYNQFNTNAYSITDYNTHNQYLHYFISSGVFGFFLFVLAMYKQVQLAIIKRDFLYLAFMSLMLVCFLSENILVRVNGVVFYSFFNSLFVKRCI